MAKKKISPTIDPDLKTVLSVYRKYAPRLRKRKGVVAVSFGLKRTSGCYGFESLPHLSKPKREKVTYAILVYVKEKLRESSLPKNQLLPKVVGGVPVDVLSVPKGRSSAGSGDDGSDVDFPSLIGGAPIGLASPMGWGTLGIVGTRNADGQQRLLTCAHVAFGIPASQNPGDVSQPPRGNTIAIGTPDVNGLNWSLGQDCATVIMDPVNPAKAAVTGQISSFGQVNGIIAQDELIVNLKVMKFGAKSGPTTGRVVTPFLPQFWNKTLEITFFDQILIRSEDGVLPFAEGGDSGALIVAEQDDGLAAIGIQHSLFENDSTHAVAVPIAVALKGLGLQL